MDKESLSESEVARAIYRSVLPGGGLRELLSLGQLAFVHMDTCAPHPDSNPSPDPDPNAMVCIYRRLFVHGGLVGGPWEGSATGVDCLGYVPGQTERVGDVRHWVQQLNEWKQQMVAEWLRQPFWVDPVPVANGGDELRRSATLKRWQSIGGGGNTNVIEAARPTRAAEAAMDYVAPGCVPSVIMGRHQDKQGMPMPVPPELVDRLRKQRITKLAVGHTPQGNAPTVVQCSGLDASEKLLVVAADTSFSDMSAADKRGVAFSEVQFLKDGCVRVYGVLQDDKVISFDLPDPETALVGFSLPVLDVVDIATPLSESSPTVSRDCSPSMFSMSRDEVLEQSLLETLGGKPYHIKAWMPEEQEYLLYNVNGFVVSYLALSGPETQLLFRIARREGKAVPTNQAIQDVSTRLTESDRRSILVENRSACFERIAQARTRLEEARLARVQRALVAASKLRKGKTHSGRRRFTVYSIAEAARLSRASSGAAVPRSTSLPASTRPQSDSERPSSTRDSTLRIPDRDSPSCESASSRKNIITVMAPGDTDIIGLLPETVS